MPDDSEEISIQKAAGGLVDPKNTIKSLVFNFHTFMLALVILGGIHIWQLIFPKKANQVQKQSSSIVFGKDSGVQTVNVVNQQDQNSQKKNVGLELTASSEDVSLHFKKYFNDNLFVSVGPKWKYDGDTENRVLPEIRVGYDF